MVMKCMLMVVTARSALAIVTSDISGSHVSQSGQEAFGIDTSGVVIIGGMRNPTPHYQFQRNDPDAGSFSTTDCIPSRSRLDIPPETLRAVT
jgi:hypothetical protein